MLMFVSIQLLSGCVDYNDEAKAISTTIQINAPVEFTSGGNLSGRTVTLTSNSGNTLTAKTDDKGMAEFHQIIPDVYTISTSWDIDQAEYTVATGKAASEGYFATISGNSNNQLIKSDNKISLNTNLVAGASLLISKMYYAGSKDNNNKNYGAGLFLEIYNQTNSDIDVSGLYIGLIETNSTPAYTLDNLKDVYKDTVVLCKQIFRIPITSSHMIAPGGTIILTNSAIDHTINGAHEFNLLNADYEAKDVTGKTVNNSATPALDLIFSNLTNFSKMNLLNSGPNGIIIFRTKENVADFKTTYPYGKTKGNLYSLVPKKYVIDGVDILKYSATGVDLATKHMSEDIDGGYTNINAISGYNGEVIYRKTSTRRGTNGHKILQDSNNSINDFQTSTTINIREYDE
ncbi:MAG: DUF4876 domain-containing protein [Prevotella sp.]|nr:DUF4876 domain-containing protein [Prevotella sp.]MBP8038086.1 DUF4876 domain-containing protein [Prevotella sp.]MBP8757247.1 DUF4876 domain-containing protein [Prevotella sp.]